MGLGFEAWGLKFVVIRCFMETRDGTLRPGCRVNDE